MQGHCRKAVREITTALHPCESTFAKSRHRWQMCALGMGGASEDAYAFAVCAEYELAAKGSRKRARKARPGGGGGPVICLGADAHSVCNAGRPNRHPNADAPIHWPCNPNFGSQGALPPAAAAARFWLRIPADAQRRIRQCQCKKHKTGSSVAAAQRKHEAYSSSALRRRSQQITAAAGQKREGAVRVGLTGAEPHAGLLGSPHSTRRLGSPLLRFDPLGPSSSLALVPQHAPLPFSSPHTHTLLPPFSLCLAGPLQSIPLLVISIASSHVSIPRPLHLHSPPITAFASTQPSFRLATPRSLTEPQFCCVFFASHPS